MIVNFTLLSLLTGTINDALFLPLFESHENTIVEFLFCYLSKWECKKYIWCSLLFIAIEVYPTMRPSVIVLFLFSAMLFHKKHLYLSLNVMFPLQEKYSRFLIYNNSWKSMKNDNIWWKTLPVVYSKLNFQSILTDDFKIIHIQLVHKVNAVTFKEAQSVTTILHFKERKKAMQDQWL